MRVIQGDGMNPDTINQLYNILEILGWSADNLTVGSGGGLLQQVDRDTMKFAIKASAAKIDGKWIDIVKNPITDPGKKSKTGRFDAPEFGLQTVFENGEVLIKTTLDEIKAKITETEGTK